MSNLSSRISQPEADEAVRAGQPSIGRGTVITYESYEISLADLLRRFWRLKWLHLLIAIAIFGAAYLLIKQLPVKFKSEAILHYNVEDGGGVEGALNSSSALQGIFGKGSQSSELTQLLARLKTRSFLKPMIERHNLLPFLFPKQWNQELRAWDAKKGPSPTSDDGASVLAGSIKAKLNDDTAFVDFSVSSLDPGAALTLANIIPREFNGIYRREKLEEYDQMVAFIQRELEQTSNNDLRRLLFALYSRRLSERIIVNVRPEYPFRIIDEPLLPLGPYSPNARLIYLLAATGAVTLMILITMLWPTRR